MGNKDKLGRIHVQEIGESSLAISARKKMKNVNKRMLLQMEICCQPLKEFSLKKQ